MSPVLAVILFVVFFVLMIVLSNKTKMPIGLLGVLFAFILAGWFAGSSPMAVVGYFPTNTIITLFIASAFFCFVQQTGLFSAVVERVMNASRGKTAIIPIALMLSAAIVGGLGGAEVAPLLMSPIAFTLVAVAGLNPLLAVISTYAGTCLTGIGFWTSGGSTVRSLAEASIGEAPSFISSYESLIFLACFFLVVFFIAYFIFKGNKLDPEKVEGYLSKNPEPLTKDQKFALKVVIGVILVTMIPVLIQTIIYKNPVTGWMANHLALKQNCLIGILIFCIAGVGDAKEIFKNRIPWVSLVNIAGCCMIDLLAQGLTSAIPAWLIPAALIIICALLSFASNMFAIVPMFAPMAAALAAATGLHEATLVACIIAGCNATGISPVSMGGSLHLIGANEEQRAAIFKKQWLTAVVIAVFMTVVSLLGVWKVLDGIFY